MIKKHIIRVIALFVALTFLALLTNCTSKSISYEAPYFGQESPKNTPQVFAEGIISKGLHEHSGFDISPNQDFAFWTISLNGHKMFLQLKKEKNSWGEPEVANFSGQYRDEYHFFSPDGKTLYFNSYRPENDTASIPKKFKHWKSELRDGKWTEATLNKLWDKDLWPYSMSENRTVFGWANYDDSKRDGDIYVQRFKNGKYLAPEKLSDSINSTAIEYCPLIAPNEEYIIFGRMGAGKGDGLYISFKMKNGEWCKAIHLPQSINTGRAERFPKLSPDGKYLFFNRQAFKYQANAEQKLNYKQLIEKYVNSPSNGLGDIYWVEMDEILKLKPNQK